MLAVYRDDLFEEHETPEDHPECPERLPVILDALRDCPAVTAWRPTPPGLEEAEAAVRRVHDADYVRSVAALAAAGGGSLDPETAVSPRSYEAALAATACLSRAVDLSLSGEEPRAFVVARPPGHHARPARGMGFCLFNHVAVAAARARDEHGLDRVAIVDFDVHHGNGTQEAFYERGEVLYASLHRDRFYPGGGAAHETGRGPGQGATLNVPLACGASPAEYQAAFRAALEQVAAFQPQLLLVSAGFDAYHDDPLGHLGLHPEHFRWIGEELRALAEATCQGRMVSVLEGGYAIDALGDLVRTYLEGAALPAPSPSSP